ncbi:MAG: isoprenyl transferase [Bacteroidales bacterium]
MNYKDKINKEKLPQHVALIMDGNGRWAKQRGKERIFGHENGVQAVRNTVEAAGELGIPYLTFYAFSTENWERPKEEVDTLMDLLVKAIKAETKDLNKNGVKLQAIGDIKNLPETCQEELKEAIKITENNTRLTAIIALSYSSKWEIIEAVKKIGKEIKAGQIKPEEIDNKLFSSYLNTKNIPDPDLLIRTSGEQRISNFLLWQLAYSELYFTPVLWPDFNKENFYKAIVDYQSRERRYGKTESST